MEKISSAQLDGYLVKAAQLLRAQQEEINSLKATVASFERREQAEKIASLAVERGALAEDEADEYAEHLATSDQDLKMVEDFVGRASHGLSLGKPLEKTASAEGSEGDGQVDVLTAFLMNSDLA